MLSDINSNFGMDGAEFEVFGVDAFMNLWQNLFRTSPLSDRFEYIPMGIAIEKFLQEPPSPQGADQIFMLIQQAQQYYIPNVKLDLSRSRVLVENSELGNYLIMLVIDGDNLQFYI